MPYKDPELRKQKAKEYSRASYLRNKEKVNARSKQWAEENAERMKELQAEWYLENKDKVKAQREAWAEANPERAKELQRQSRKRTGSGKAWKAENKHKVNAYASKRRACERNATPSWISEIDEFIAEEIFLQREDISSATGIKHEVDHVIPLVSEEVCGLHVWWNMRVITEFENRSKGNKL